ncbi:MAG: hypothetical protein J1E98_09520 [Lachnospiraceae bacterium]|nr:hypothetical protein [Lachnospiraceae bacterium]
MSNAITVRREHYEKGTENEHANYHLDVLEAKIYLGEGPVCSIGSEFIENSGEYRERYCGMSEEQYKQDCEIKAFRRLAEKIKKDTRDCWSFCWRQPVCVGAGNGEL